LVRYFLLIIIAGIAGGIIARRKSAARCCGFFLCAIVPLRIADIIIFSPLASNGYTKKCPYCIVIIKEDGIVCTHCGRELPIEMIKINNKV